jgi:SHS2 domain-containing protein
LKAYSYPKGGPPADLLVEGHGEDLGEAFEQVALAMYNVVTPLDGINNRLEFQVSVDGIDMMSVLFNFLDELIYKLDAEGLVAKKLDVIVDPLKLTATATCYGEKFSQATHKVGIAVKAVTYHMMELKKSVEGWRIQLVFDT